MQNMMLVVGPGTPASLCWPSDAAAFDSDEDGSDGDHAMDDDDDDSDDDDSDASDDLHRPLARMSASNSDSSDDEEKEYSLIVNNDALGANEEWALDASSSSDGSSSDEQYVAPSFHQRSTSGQVRVRLNRFRRLLQQQDETGRQQPLRPTIRHGGCINTARWLDCPWRISLAGSNGSNVPTSMNVVESWESTTQLVTSGDDRQVKFWDVRDAMGSANPLPGGWNSLCPFASTKRPNATSIRSSWLSHYSDCDDYEPKIAGCVSLLASMSTGHRLNVFDVKPVHAQQGKVLTCAADGYLRLCDLESERSTVVVDPVSEENDPMMSLFLSSRMAFSHHMVTANAGLLCSERGLHRFDLRLPPREQHSRSLLQPAESCKACAVWSPFGAPSNGDVESNFVFAGGSATDYVGLYDLRMEGESRLECLQKYKPSSFDPDSCQASMSGLDVSKDGKELLVSYEGDQIYTFPTFYKTSSAAGPTLEEIQTKPEQLLVSGIDGCDETVMRELASYGGHLNRLTFLKNAKYAGPNDEYICTGSDSGHAWIYERSSGAVVSLLGGDSMTCNGVLPHPSLPVFLTYGIDSTAKLWRATGPVDCKADDSPSGRVKCSFKQPYEMSPVVRSWDGVQALLTRLGDTQFFMPDFVASSQEVADERFSTTSTSKRGIDGYDSPHVGNTLRALPYILRQNRFQCYKALHLRRSVPVESLYDFDHHCSIIRSRFQADRLGLPWNANVPWILEAGREDGSTTAMDPAELVPDSPSDWIEFDAGMVDSPISARQTFAISHFQGKSREEDLAFLIERYTDLSVLGVRPCELDRRPPWLANQEAGTNDATTAGDELDLFEKQSRLNLYSTALLLKESGNVAMKAGSLDVAARRYDKAIQYCAVAFMRYNVGYIRLQHLTKGHSGDEAEGESNTQIVVWSPLLKVLITSRLNMALLLLKPHFAQSIRAADQSKHALELLDPFVRQNGKVAAKRDETQNVIGQLEPGAVDIFKEAKALQAKAYFRLGCAELEQGFYKAAVRCFDQSIKATTVVNTPGSKPSLVVRKLQEAKLKLKTKKKRDREKFEQVMTSTEDRVNGGAVPHGGGESS